MSNIDILCIFDVDIIVIIEITHNDIYIFGVKLYRNISLNINYNIYLYTKVQNFIKICIMAQYN